MFFRALVGRLDAVGGVSLHSTAFRHVSAQTDPKSGIGARIQGGRWNPPESFSTLYLGLSRDTVIAERRRAAARQGLAPEDFLPRDLYEFDVILHAVLDLREPATRESVGLSDAELVAEDARACQQIGEAAHYLGLEGIVAPSATSVGNVIAVFLDRLGPDSRLDARRLEEWLIPPEE